MYLIMISYIKFIIYIIAIYMAILTVTTRCTYQEEKEEESHKIYGPLAKNVFDRNLVHKEPFGKDIITENGGYFKNTSFKKFNGKILSYCNTANYIGYDEFEIWAKKFDIISPDWFPIHRMGTNTYKYSKLTDYGNNWMNDIKRFRNTSKSTLEVYPRFTLEEFTDQDILHLLSFYTERKAFFKLILQACHYHNFDGVLIEVWPALIQRMSDEIMYNFIVILAKDLKAEGIKFILLIPAFLDIGQNLFTINNFEYLYPHVDYFMLRAFVRVYSSQNITDTNAPLQLMRKSIEYLIPVTDENYKLKRKKILLNLNLYGFDYTSDTLTAISGQQYLDLLKNYTSRLKFNNENIESYFSTKYSNDYHLVFYPTLYTINERIKLAKELGVGLALSESTSTLNYFCDLF